MRELKSCPFCGKEASVYREWEYRITGGDEMYYCRCDYCGARTTLQYSVDKAVEVWNRRDDDGK